MTARRYLVKLTARTVPPAVMTLLICPNIATYSGLYLAAAELAEHVADDALSEREVALLRKVATGTSNKMIADQLSVSEATVKVHMKSILAKLDANDRTHAMTIAMRRGFLDG
jgi:DNA-binding NarL/FixJ family response regulator